MTGSTAPITPTPPAPTTGQDPGTSEPVVVIREPAPANPAPQNQPVEPEAIQRARTQEREKLYGRLESADSRLNAMQAELETLRQEREARLAAEAAAQKAQEEAERQKQLAETSAKDLVLQQKAEWEQRFEALMAEREIEREKLAKEAAFNELRAYTQEQVRLNTDKIAPQLLDLVSGSTREEVDASIALMTAKTEAILQEVQQAQVDNRAQMRGVSIASIPSTAIDDGTAMRTLTAGDIKNMSMPEYARLRNQLIGSAASSSKSRGLFD